MKVVLSIPDATFARGEALAERMGLSRSELYTKAIEAFIARELLRIAGEEPSEADEAMIAEAIREVRAKRNAA